MNTNVIITASDIKYGDFLIEHWYKSLKDTCNLSNIDVFVIDYGLSTAQKFYLEHNGVKVFKGEKDGHVVIIRFRETKKILSTYNYDQALLCDSGDIIFQQDISPLFSRNKEQFRAAEEDIKSPFQSLLRMNFSQMI
ncbi:MAG: hypothetical protein OQK82_00560 [Candidatus Pacearchaeota archaeon]|nr:hypothetical protein [Candidatus Pacearchaeota archaeon]